MPAVISPCADTRRTCRGVLSSMADDLALGDISLLMAGLGAMLAFLVGAACTAMLVNWGRRRSLRSEYAFPLLLEAALLVTFSVMGGSLDRPQWFFISLITLLLCFTMGLQNAIITKISNAEIRTTHVTGIVTDIGIELGKLFYWNRSTSQPDGPMVLADRKKLKLLSSLIVMFFFRGSAGRVGLSIRRISVLPAASRHAAGTGRRPYGSRPARSALSQFAVNAGECDTIIRKG